MISIPFPKIYSADVPLREILDYRIIPTTARLTFDIYYQHPGVTHQGDDESEYYFKASNGVEIISRSRMDIQTDRIWLFGGTKYDRSGSMVFSSNAKRNVAYSAFEAAIKEWERFLKV